MKNRYSLKIPVFNGGVVIVYVDALSSLMMFICCFFNR